MNIFKRKTMNEIEGINIKDLPEILNGRRISNLPSYDSIIFDSILLSDNTKIKCVKNYYVNSLGLGPRKGKSHSTCVAVQKFFRVGCRPYECDRCHKMMITMRNNGQVRPR